MHIFSATCKVDSVLGLFDCENGRREAVEWFRRHRISKLYLESYRHGQSVGAEVLRSARDFFLDAGFEVGGCITTTQMSQRQATWDIETCFTDPTGLEFLQETVEIAAGIFDLIILDDFFFSSCRCDYCKEARGQRSWGDFRCDLMLSVARDRVLNPARVVNKNVKIIIKYPLWYESYYERGYDLLRETDLFDIVWIGTETRDPDSTEAGRRPQTQASWIQAWMNDIAGEKCGGAWYDPIDTSPATFLEQARQTIIGGARESLLHCYDYLGTTNPGLAIHGKDLEIANGLADAAAFAGESESLQILADMLTDMRPYGVLVPKKPNCDAPQEPYLPGFVGMLGVPVVASSTLKKSDAAFLGAQAAMFDDTLEFMAQSRQSDIPLIVTENFLNILSGTHAELPQCLAEMLDACRRLPAQSEADTFLTEIEENLCILHCPDDLWELTRIPQDQLDRLRNFFLRPVGIEFFAPSKVSLHLFRSDDRYCEIIENFNDFAVSVRLCFMDQVMPKPQIAFDLPKASSSIATATNDASIIEIGPRAMTVLTR